QPAAGIEPARLRLPERHAGRAELAGVAEEAGLVVQRRVDEWRIPLFVEESEPLLDQLQGLLGVAAIAGEDPFLEQRPAGLVVVAAPAVDGEHQVERRLREIEAPAVAEGRGLDSEQARREDLVLRPFEVEL